jgi:hypothetical protein
LASDLEPEELPSEGGEVVSAEPLASDLVNGWSLNVIDVPLQQRDTCGYHAVANSCLRLGKSHELPPVGEWPVHATAEMVSRAVDGTSAATQTFVLDSVSSIIDAADLESHCERKEIADACLQSAMESIGKGVDTAIIINDKEQVEDVQHGRIGHWISLVVKPSRRTIDFCDSAWGKGPKWQADRQDLYRRFIGGLSLLCFFAEPVLPPPPPPPPPPQAPAPPDRESDMEDSDPDEFDFTVQAEPTAGSEADMEYWSDDDSDDIGSGDEIEALALYHALSRQGITTVDDVHKVVLSSMSLPYFILQCCGTWCLHV